MCQSLLELVWRRIALDACFKASVVIVKNVKRLRRWSTGFDRKRDFEMLKEF